MLAVRLHSASLGNSGVAGGSVPSQELLKFQLDHARARDAVHEALDAEATCGELNALGLSAVKLATRRGARTGPSTTHDVAMRLPEPDSQPLDTTSAAYFRGTISTSPSWSSRCSASGSTTTSTTTAR